MSGFICGRPPSPHSEGQRDTFACVTQGKRKGNSLEMHQSILSYLTRFGVRRNGLAKLSLGIAERRLHWSRAHSSRPELSRCSSPHRFDAKSRCAGAPRTRVSPLCLTLRGPLARCVDQAQAHWNLRPAPGALEHTPLPSPFLPCRQVAGSLFTSSFARYIRSAF